MPGIEETIGQLAGGKLDSAFNIWSQGVLNRAQQKFGIAMYNKQRADNLADWHMQNEYNSPSGQMARLREAGLNPNLVYGHGADAQMGAPVRQASAPDSKSQDAPDVKQSGSILDYYDIKMKEAQVNNLEAQNTVLTNDAALKAAQTHNVEQQTRRGEFDYGFESEVRPYSLEFRKGAVAKQSAETKTMLDRNEREIAMNTMSLKKTVEEILNYRKARAKTDQEIKEIQQRIKLMEKDEKIKDYEIKLNEQGIQKNDPVYWRVLNGLVNGHGVPEGLLGAPPKQMRIGKDLFIPWMK